MSKTFIGLDPSWWTDHGDYFREQLKFWFEALDNVNSAPSVVFDLGCGPGRFTVPLAKMSKLVIAVDINPKMLKLVREKRENLNLTDKIPLVVADAQHLPFRKNTADMINFMGTLVHMPEQRKVIEEICKVTAAGGRIIVDQTNYLSLGFLWEGLQRLLSGIFSTERDFHDVFVKRNSIWQFRRLFSNLGLSVEKIRGFQVIPLVPVVGSFNVAHSESKSLSLTRNLDRIIRRLPLTFLAYNIIIVCKKTT